MVWKEVKRSCRGWEAVLAAVQRSPDTRLSVARTEVLSHHLFGPEFESRVEALYDFGLVDALLEVILRGPRDGNLTTPPPWLYALKTLNAIIMTEAGRDQRSEDGRRTEGSKSPRLARVEASLPKIIKRIYDDRAAFETLGHDRSSVVVARFLRTISETFIIKDGCVNVALPG